MAARWHGIAVCLNHVFFCFGYRYRGRLTFDKYLCFNPEDDA